MKNNPNKMEIILITETNFILDIAFEQSEQAEQLLTLIQQQNIVLVIPEYAFAEAEGNIKSTIRKRNAIVEQTIAVLRQADRSAYQDLDELITRLQQFQESSQIQEFPFLHSKIKSLSENSFIIPFTADISVKAELRDLKYLAPQKSADRRILESVLFFAQTNRGPDFFMLFLTFDKEDFNVPSIRDELAAVNVELFFSAGECIKRIKELLS